MTPRNSTEIRQAFLDFFLEMGHEVVPSSPLPVLDNPTLLFTNAGMNQFADTFLGKKERPYKRATSSQKCMRVQGKHNDLENVGPSPRHHTFFEMLGNFSFGDYFKAGAIRYAYDFLTKVCQVPVDNLWYTVHIDDDDAYDIWVKEIGVAAERVVRMGDKTNFWMMGDVGPCGPTSEIHYDWGPEYCTCHEENCAVLLDNDCERWLEIWNLVFMQYSQDADGLRTPLPKPGVDTGMGLERITAVVEQQPINYETDLFVPAMNRIQKLLGDTDGERERHVTGYRVIADHGRAAAFLVADGVLPGNVGRSYVLRMIIRRAARFGRGLGFTDPFLAEIAQVYIDQMGDYYHELKRHQEHIREVLSLEEKRFARTLDSALAQMDEILANLHHVNQREIPGDIAFNMYATYGLPLEITRDVASEKGFSIDEIGFNVAREAHAETSGAGAFGQYDVTDNIFAELLVTLASHGVLDPSGVDYDPYSSARIEAAIVAIVKDGKGIDRASHGDYIEVVASATPFYVESGGEVSDSGWIIIDAPAARMHVDDIREPVPGLIVHSGEVISGHLSTGQVARLEVDNQRRWDIRRNHTATHILHQELRSKLGNHVTQQGSLVAPERLRFDFSYGQAVDEKTLAEIEKAINEIILSNQTVFARHMGREEAINAGAMALFGEKYGEIVRTIQIGDENSRYSFELCGGLHVQATGDIGLFQFVNEEAVGAGLRRVEAVTGRGAYALVHERIGLLAEVARKLGSPVSEIDTRLDALLNGNRQLQKEVVQLRQEKAKGQFAELLERMQEVDGIPLLVAQVEVSDMNTLREMADWFRDRVDNGVAVLAAVLDSRVILIVAVAEELVPRGIEAGDIVGKVAKMVGGGGGGRPTLAQAGGKEPGKLPQALAAVPELITASLSK